MGNVAEKVRSMTVDEFLDWSGDGHVGKLELVYGEVRAMSPASGEHAIIQANLAGIIHAQLKKAKKPCRLGTEAPVIPRFDSVRNLRAPDLAVTCLPMRDDRRFPDPVLVIEVMSPGNRKETWEAIEACATIPTLAEILVVESERIEAQIFRRDPDGGWPEKGIVLGRDDTVTLTSLDVTFPLLEAYDGTGLA